ncbi:hypothetical protein D7V97_40970, partial [Corallococcus sp. CA053C]
MLLRGAPRVVDGARTVKLLPQEQLLVPEETSLVREWGGHTGVEPGYAASPGVPVEGSVTLDRVVMEDHEDSHAEGRFVYRYTDGSKLTCTFHVTDRVYSDGSDWGGG